MTRRLYYDDAYLTTFRARIVGRGCDPCEVFLDQTAFYPTSGGQPYDTGLIHGVPVIDVLEDGPRILHRLARPVNVDEVECSVDWQRRFDHMQQHSGQHLLSAVFAALYGMNTLSFHLGSDISTLDLDAPALEPAQILRAEQRANELVFQNRPITIAYEQASEAAGLRKESARQGLLRIVIIRDLDRSACGGTHVRATGEIGPIMIRRLEKIRGNIRVEFLCGLRAVRRARADFDALTQVARAVSASLDETPSLVAALHARLSEVEKSARRLARELAETRGRRLYYETPPGPDGRRLLFKRLPAGSLSEELRVEAQSFTAQPKSIYLAAIDEPPSLLLAASDDENINPGVLLKEALSRAGGRGGGNARIAQGSLPSKDALDGLLAALPFGV